MPNQIVSPDWDWSDHPENRPLLPMDTWLDSSHSLLGSLGGAHIMPGNGFPAWKWSKTHSQFSISHANGGGSGAEDPKQQIIWKSLSLAWEQRQWCGVCEHVYTPPRPAMAPFPPTASVFTMTEHCLKVREGDKGENGASVFHSERPWKERDPCYSSDENTLGLSPPRLPLELTTACSLSEIPEGLSGSLQATLCKLCTCLCLVVTPNFLCCFQYQNATGV